jgi:DNA-binding SARP family transcriptional activator
MNSLHISLFGRFDVRRGEHVLVHVDARRAQELFCYLLLYRDRPRHRETLASLLWPTMTAAQSMKNLRNALWELQTALDSEIPKGGSNILLVDRDWIGINPEADFWLDVAEFECASTFTRGISGSELDEHKAKMLRKALELYKGDLLEGWYQDWCLFERERLQHMYLAMLEKQMAYCETRGDCEAGLDYGTRALRCDVAHERIHRRLMRLHCLAGNRTAALRQYERCVAFLQQELNVTPSARTVALYERICAGHPFVPGGRLAGIDETIPPKAFIPPRVFYHLRQLETTLAEAQHQLQQALQTLELDLEDST